MDGARDLDQLSLVVEAAPLAMIVVDGAGRRYQQLLLLAAPMHDIGKVAIPDRILLKPGKLSPDEWTIMMTHARAGYEILKDSESELVRLGAEIALTHHEKF